MPIFKGYQVSSVIVQCWLRFLQVGIVPITTHTHTHTQHCCF